MVNLVLQQFKRTNFRSTLFFFRCKIIGLNFYEYINRKYRYIVKTYIYLFQFFVVAAVFNFDNNGKNFLYRVK